VNPRTEAQRRAGPDYDPRVLEPSPPSIRAEPFADDPTAVDPRVEGRALLSPVTNGDVTWDELCRTRGDAELSAWCADRWLGAWRPLRPLDDIDAFAATRDAWHAVAEQVVCRARHRATGRIGLRVTAGGFGTPFYGDDEQVRVEGTDVVVTRGSAERRAPITTLGAAADLVGPDLGVGVPAQLFTPSSDGDPARALPVDETAAGALADWYGLVTCALAQLRIERADASPSLIQLWPEHFDVAVELGDEARKTRANFGGSPGDDAHPLPYLYVGPWDAAGIDRGDSFWNEPFGASMPYTDVRDRDGALAFLRAGAARVGT
jgi:hypothetical protein